MSESSRTFCYRCSTKLERKSDRSWYCSSCDYIQYDNPRPCVEVALFNPSGQLLVSKRAFEPGKGLYDLPGGFVEMGETFEEGLYRELEEETSLTREDIKNVTYLKSYAVPYPWPPETYNNVVVLFIAELVTNKDVHPSDDSEQLIWLNEEDVDSLPWSISILKKNAHQIFQQKHD